MSTKSTATSVEKSLSSALIGYKEDATAVKEAHKTARQSIKDDPMASDLAKRERLADLDRQTRSDLDGIRGQQEVYIKGLRDKVERELRGNQPADAASVVSRRDASDRARRIQDQREAMDVLNDAIANGDTDLAHAIGNRARNTAMLDVAEAYTAAFPTPADSAAALTYIEEVASGPAYNMSNSITYAAPLTD